MRFMNFLLLIFTAIFFTACAVAQTAGEAQSAIKQINVKEAREATDGKDVQFIDVRTEAEYKDGHAPKTLNLPLDSLEQNLSKLDKTKSVYVICQTGRRSQKGAEILQKNGFKDLYNIQGGTSAWQSAGFPIEK